MSAKTLMIAASVAGASAMAAPRIELDLSMISQAQLIKLKTSISGAHNLGYKQPNGEAVGSRQDWTERCPAGTTTTAMNCPIPEAMAFDHHDGSLPVTSSIFVVDKDGTRVEVADQQVSSIDYTKRATYLLKFDASDAAGNHAEQVVFALILDDTTKPVITQCGGDKTVEAATTFKLCHSDAAWDNMDKSVDNTLTYTVQGESDGEFKCQACTGAAAAASITGKETGTFLVTMFAHDQAGTYGHQYENNVVEASRRITVVDTTHPVIEIEGAHTATHECATTYTDLGADASDTLDDANGVAIQVHSDSTVQQSKVGSYSVTYTASDSHLNAANPKSRVVKVQDKTDPKVTLNGAAVIQHRSAAGAQLVDPGVGCQDTCDTSNSKTITTSWGAKPFDDRAKGEYVRTYTCTDASGNSHSETRKFEVIDEDAPIITLVGESTVYMEASRTATYSDQGANCHDYTDGLKIPQISGDVVNMRVPGQYTIQYTCKDAAGNSAVPIDRTVVVRDTLCPEVTVKGDKFMHIEAGFPYTDAGAEASDSLDGVIDESKITVDGDTVDTANAFYSRRSCKQIKAEYTAAKTGEYFITIWSGAKYTRTSVWCDMDSLYQGKQVGFTYKAVDAGVSTVPYGTDAGTCATHGMQMAQKITDESHKAVKAHYCDAAEEECRYFPTDKTTETNFYICAINDLNTPLAQHFSHDIAHDEIAHAEAGKYVISYHVQDKAGNSECSAPTRTVVVKDTLPPVISLNFGGKVIARSSSAAVGLSGVANPAGAAQDGNKWGNPFLEGGLMAETASATTNGWVLAGVASAVTGLALLSFSSRKQAVATSVPV